MAIKINWKSLQNRVINGKDTRRVLLNWAELRPTEIPHIDWHVDSSFMWSMPWWYVGTGTEVTNAGIVKAEWASYGSIIYNNSTWMPSLAYAKGIMVIVNFDWVAPEWISSSYYPIGCNVQGWTAVGKCTTLLTVRPSMNYWQDTLIIWGNTSSNTMTWVTNWNYTYTLFFDMQDENAATVSIDMEWPSWFSKDKTTKSLTQQLIESVRTQTELSLFIYGWVTIKHIDLYIWNNIAQPIHTSGIYWSQAQWLITASSDWSNRITMADKNLWATTVYNYNDVETDANCGKLFQWWNNYAFDRWDPSNTSTTKVDASNYWPNNYYSSSTFIKTTNPLDAHRDSSQNPNLRWWITWTMAAMKWPCPNGFHVPTKAEWDGMLDILYDIWAWTQSYLEAPMVYLKLPAGWHIIYMGYFRNVPKWGQYFTSEYGKAIWVSPTSVWWETSAISWNSIRPFANSPVTPDTTRTVLF